MSVDRGKNQPSSITKALICRVTHQPFPRASKEQPDVCVYCGRVKAHQSTGSSPRELEILIPCDTCACELAWHARRGDQFSHTLRHGDVGILPSGVRHSKRWLRDTYAILLNLKQSWVESFGQNLVSDVLVEPLQGYLMRDPLIGGLTTELKRECRAENADTSGHVAALGHCLATRVLLVLTGRHEKNGPIERQLSDTTLRRVTAYIEAHLGEKIALATLAREARLSPNHFTVLFKATLGATPEQYVLRARLLRAKALIETGSYTVNQVAYMAGFADHSHLTVQFRRQFGVPPSAYLPRIRTV